jgi:hypothetical protein
VEGDGRRLLLLAKATGLVWRMGMRGGSVHGRGAS